MLCSPVEKAAPFPVKIIAEIFAYLLEDQRREKIECQPSWNRHYPGFC